MKCPKCNMNLQNGIKFCIYCGEKLDDEKKLYCTRCGSKLQEDAKFCTSCGLFVADDVASSPDNSKDDNTISVVKEKIIRVEKEDDKPLAREGLILGLIFCVLFVSIVSIFVVSYYARDFDPKYYEKEI